MEELKKLARIYKLNERRNFWKNHSERSDMVAALLEHVTQNQVYTTKKVKLNSKEEFKPAPPPLDFKPTVTGRQLFAIMKLQDYCGKTYFNRDENENELVIRSKFFDFPRPDSHIDTIVDTWRDEDFNLKDESLMSPSQIEEELHNSFKEGHHHSDKTSKRAKKGVAGIKNKARIVKHRNLATHLMNYSAKPDLNKNTLSLKSVQTFINVSDSEDSKTVSNCMIAISNIASSDHVRSLLFEVNALLKFTNMLQHIRGKSALRAAGLLFFYFSCDKEIEDRVYNSCSSFLQANGASKDQETRTMALYTLNNLMPCIDRQRVADITMRIIHAHFELSLSTTDKSLLSTYLLIMQNMSCFSNVQSTLLGLNILELLGQVARLSVDEKNTDLAKSMLKIMQAFLQVPEQAVSSINLEYVNILITLFEFEDESVLIQTTRVATTLMTLTELRPMLHQSAFVLAVANSITHLKMLSNKLSRELAKLVTNITVGEGGEVLQALVEQKLPDAILRLMKDPNTAGAVKCVVVQSLQNLLSVPSIGAKLATRFFDPLVKFLKDNSNLNGAMALYNISCIPQCRTELVNNKMHMKMLEFMVTNNNLEMKCAFLQVLVQMSSSNVCVIELLKHGLIHKLESQLKDASRREIWNDVSLMLLAVVAFAASDLQVSEQKSIIQILRIICVSAADEQVIENCSNVLKYISIRFYQFDYIDPVVRAILDVSSYEKEDVVENLSNVLYNMTCHAENIDLMLRDSDYVDIMIHIMRKGNLEVQESIAQSMRNLCSHANCIKILLETDILSDLIVIALLRTSSEEIKIVCSETFYNMLCHPSTRLKLLQGDLWWAVMRLCRTDSHQVRSTCARALFDLSTDAVNIAPLRVHHVLAFVKDIITSGNEAFLLMCLNAVHNLLGQYGKVDETPVTSHEVISAIRIGADMLPRMTKIDHIRDILLLLLKCALQENVEGIVDEFVHLYIMDTLENTRAIWSTDKRSRMYVSRLIWELSKHDAFTKSVILPDLEPIMSAVYRDKPAFEVCDNLVGAFLHQVVRENITPAHIIHLPIWKVFLREVLSADSSVLAPTVTAAHQPSGIAGISPGALALGGGGGGHHLAAAKRGTFHGGGGGGGADKLSKQGGSSTPVGPAGAGSGARSRSSSVAIGNFRERSTSSMVSHATQSLLDSREYSLKSAMLGLLGHCIQAILSEVPDVITKSLVLGMLQLDFLEYPANRVNLIAIIGALSTHSPYTAHLLDGKVFNILHRYLVSSVGTTRLGQAQHFVSGFLRNLSLHDALVSKYCGSADGLLCELIRELLEIQNDTVHLDLAVFFYNSANHLVKSETSLNPKFVLEMIGKISNVEHDKDVEATRINKFTISMILNKYTFGSGVEPGFVQYMYTYMQQNHSMSAPTYMENVSFAEQMDSFKPVLHADFLKSKNSVSVDLMKFEAGPELWKPTITTQPKQHENIILKIAHATAVMHEQLEGMGEASSMPIIFGKILKEFDALKESVGAADNTAIDEGDEDEEEEDEEEEEEEPEDTIGFETADGEEEEEHSTSVANPESSAAASVLEASSNDGSPAEKGSALAVAGPADEGSVSAGAEAAGGGALARLEEGASSESTSIASSSAGASKVKSSSGHPHLHGHQQKHQKKQGGGGGAGGRGGTGGAGSPAGSVVSSRTSSRRSSRDGDTVHSNATGNSAAAGAAAGAAASADAKTSGSSTAKADLRAPGGSVDSHDSRVSRGSKQNSISSNR